MAVIEQLVFGLAPDREKGREVLGSSPGISRDCAQEVVRLCESWGAVPADGLRRAALLCFPLTTRLSSLLGELHVVIRIAEGLKPIYHALVLSRGDFQEFDLNPFALAQENVFLDRWAAGEDLPRRDVRPGALAPLVSPPPGAGDVGFADEAVRQMLANQRLLLALERASSDSDRFLALVVAGLPRPLRQELRFASWSPSGTNSYTLAATYQENALYTSWQPFLMTSVFGQLNDACEEYLEQLKVLLRNGDLTGLERHSRNARVDLTRTASGLTRRKPQALAATVDKRNSQKTPPSSPPSRKKPVPATTAGKTPVRPRPEPRRLTANSTTGSTAPRPKSRPRSRRRSSVSGARRGFAFVLSGAILLAGAYYLWTSGQWTRLPGMTAGDVHLQTDTIHGVVDVATIYQGALKGLQKAGIAGNADADSPERRRGLEMLDQAGQLLEKQGQDFLDEADQSLSGDELEGVAPAPPERIHERGKVLARELRRLALAQVSLRGQIDWQDLADLDGRDLEARFDSLLANRVGRKSVEPALTEVDHLLRSVDIRSRQVGGLAHLQDLLNREAWDVQWCRRCDAAIDDLGGVRQMRARQLRDDANVLVRLKRAEHTTDLAARAYRPDYAASTQITPAVADVLPGIHERAGRTDPRPALLTATSNLYLNLRRAVDTEATVTQRSASIENLARNRALEFDAATYVDHVGRLRFMLLEQSVAGGADLDSLPEVCFADGNRQDHLDFLQAATDGRGAAGWRQLAGELREPFLVRWATHRADALDVAANARAASFAADFAAVRQRRAVLADAVAGGVDCTTAWRDLAAAAGDLSTRYRGAFPDSVAAGRTLASVVELADALEQAPPLQLVGVTVRLDQALAAEARDVVVELQVGDRMARTTDWIRLGPAAPAGSGWVGSVDVTWELTPSTGTPVAMRVVDAASGDLIGTMPATGWLTEVGPRELGGLEAGPGVRVGWRLAGTYWQDVLLPELESAPSL